MSKATTANAQNAGSNGPVLVTGGTGKTGRRVVDRLIARGRSVRVGSRSGTPAFDWADDSTWARALEGVTSAYLAYAPDLSAPGALDTLRAFTAEAVAAGVRRLVLISDRGEAASEQAERIVADAGAEWTVVRCAWFHQNFDEGEFAGMVRSGVIALPAGAVAEPFVDADDIADVAVAALVEDGHHGQVYEVTGPESLTFNEVAQILTQASGHAVRYQAVSMPAFVAGLRAEGAPEQLAGLLEHLLGELLDGRNASLGDGVQRALGRSPRRFAEYARRAAQAGGFASMAGQEVARG
ncbi:MAG: NAD(P)H-binding protein [Planctomycetota bacterium]